MSALEQTSLVFLCFVFSTREMSADSGYLVEPRKLAVLVDGGGGDWNTGRRLCRSVNMTLATIDRHVFFFLLSHTFLPKFQRYAHKHFWIGLYQETTRGVRSNGGKYRWETDCAEMWDSMWDAGQPADREGQLCVLADNATLRWRTADCSNKQQFLCQRKEDSCSYQRTLPTCTLYITASSRFTLPNGTPMECKVLCETTLKNALPCWGFTMTSEGCVLHYQSTQPQCDVHHLQSSAYFRTCFHMFYVDGPFNRAFSNNTWPEVPHCSLAHSPAGRGVSQPTSKAGLLSVPNPSTTLQDKHPTTSSQKLTLTPDTPTHRTVKTETNDSPISPFVTEPGTLLTTALTSERTPHLQQTPVPLQTLSSSTSHQCVCKCGVTWWNKTAILQEAEMTKRKLKLDARTLSSTRRKKTSAEDHRVSSKGIAYIGVGFVAVIAAWIILPDVASLLYHVLHGVPRPWKLSRKTAGRAD